MTRYLGLDVHQESTTAVVVSAQGKHIRRDRLETNGQVLVRYVQSLAGEVHVCFEECEWSDWLDEILSPHVDHLVVYHPRWRPGPKSDSLDARDLAEKLRTGQIGCPVYKAPRRYSQLRALVQADSYLTRDVVRCKQRLRGVFRRRGMTPTSSVYDPARRDEWLAQLPSPFRNQADLLGRALDALEPLRLEAEQAMLAEASRFEITRILQTAPGIGPKRAAVLLATVVTPHRFRSKRQFWSYCGFGVVTRSSSDWVHSRNGWQRAPVMQTRGLNRTCNRTLKALFKGAALNAVMHTKDDPLRQKYDQLLEAGTRPNLARLTIARKIAATVLAMWKKEAEYRPVN